PTAQPVRMLCSIEYFLIIYFCISVSFNATVTSDHKWPRIYGGETVTIRCEIQGGGQINWTYEWRKNKTHEKTASSGEYRISGAKQSDSGAYSCRGRRDRNVLNVGSVVDAVLTIEPNRSNFYAGEFVTFTCDMNEGKDSDWYYQLRRNGEEFFPHQPHKNFRVQELDTGYSGEFQCCAYRMSSSSHSKCSKAVTVIVSDKPRATLTAGPTTIPVGGSVTLSCSVEPSAGWKYKWFRRTKNSPEVEINTNNKENRNITVRQGGIYMCDGERGNPSFYSHRSHDMGQIYTGQIVKTGLSVSLSPAVETTCVSVEEETTRILQRSGVKPSVCLYQVC
uniref:Ig-like domain-containing protein n=1 Tax=Poecilia mexicana TaxID=48701 RepID=A0A3B3X7Q6_9TELE